MDVKTEAKIFQIIADYRPNNPNKPHYYVWGTSKAEAKRRFSNKMPWLKIYNTIETETTAAQYIIERPRDFILF